MNRETLEIGKIEICLINLGEGVFYEDLDDTVTRKMHMMGETGWRFPTKKEFSYIADLIYNLGILNETILVSFEKYWSSNYFTLKNPPSGGIPALIEDILGSGIEIEKEDPIVSVLNLKTKGGKVNLIDDEWYPSIYDEGPSMRRHPKARYLAVRDI
jgi:hypothetical protein